MTTNRNQNPSRNRRHFLGEGACSLLGSTAVLNTLLNLRLAGAACAAADDAADDDYKALVCVFLFGGNDSFNMLIPTTDGEYENYQKTRGVLALPREGSESALPLKDSGVSGRTFAVHPSIAELRDLYHEGELAFVANVGTLIEPVTVQQYKNQSACRSHCSRTTTSATSGKRRFRNREVPTVGWGARPICCATRRAAAASR